MDRYRRLTDRLIRWAPCAVAGIYATVVLSGLLLRLGPLLVVEGAVAFAAAVFLVGRWRIFAAWNDLGFASFRTFLQYQYWAQGMPLGLLAATSAGALLLFVLPGSLEPSAIFATVGAAAFGISVAKAMRRWPVDALEKGRDR